MGEMTVEDMSLLDQELCDEWMRCARALRAHERYLEESTVKGYISKKFIKGKERYYLQWRDGKSIKSKYIPYDDLERYTEMLSKRKRLLDSIRHVKKDMKKIEKVVGRELLDRFISAVQKG